MLVENTENIRDVHPMLDWCWATVYDVGQTLDQHWVNASCYMGNYWPFPFLWWFRQRWRQIWSQISELRHRVGSRWTACNTHKLDDAPWLGCNEYREISVLKAGEVCPWYWVVNDQGVTVSTPDKYWQGAWSVKGLLHVDSVPLYCGAKPKGRICLLYK